jgi:3-hydroxyisobutyrate dehydrogenase
MTKLAFLGLGAMGARMVRRLAAAQFDLTVWNRSGLPSDLLDLGLVLAPSPRDAASGADVVVSMVTDDAAAQAVWAAPGTGALEGIAQGALAIECSTLTPAWVGALKARVAATGARFVDAPVMGSRPQAEAGALVHLVGGDLADIDRARPVLTAMSNAIHHLGPTPAGAVAKLAANALFGVQLGLVGELLGFVEKNGLDPKRLVEVFGSLPLMSGAAKVAAEAMLADKFAPLFPIDLVAKDFRYAASAAEVSGADLPITIRAGNVFHEAAEHGLGNENITAIAKRYR